MTQFSIAYDAFLWILRKVDREVKHALHQDTPNWRLHNVCPPCFYKLENEPDLRFSLFVSMDGNNSLRRIEDGIRNTNVRQDTRTIHSDRWIDPADVDRFKDEVQTVSPINRIIQTLANSMHEKKSKGTPDVDDDWEDEPLPNGLSKCVDRWRNAGPEQRKKMFALFEETGIFLTCCRHRFALLVCDMVKTGERWG